MRDDVFYSAVQQHNSSAVNEGGRRQRELSRYLQKKIIYASARGGRCALSACLLRTLTASQNEMQKMEVCVVAFGVGVEEGMWGGTAAISWLFCLK
jgi:hypothetical protein